MKYDMNSRIRDICLHPVGRDVINKILLQMNVKRGLLYNPVVGSLKLSVLRRLIGDKISAGFWEAVLLILNADLGDSAAAAASSGEDRWWKDAVFYQIYPRSFMDGDGDGIGDIKGILLKLDYLKALGIDGLWLCPVYDSPQDDNGYDIRNYHEIDETYGSMADFELLLKEVHKRDMKLIMDLVVNHTSDEHEWFQKAVKEPDSRFRNYYHIKKGDKGEPPNNWISFFSGSAWKRLSLYSGEEPGSGEYWALRLFSSKQMDLNWDNPELREEIYQMVRWWLEKGIDGFRLDVINYISKAPGLPQGDEFIGELMGFRGIEHYFHGPKLHAYLRELRVQAFEPFDAFSVGETPGIGMEAGKLLTAPDRKELDMIFSFDHLESPGKVRFDDYVYDLVYLKDYYKEWMEHYSNISQMALFYDNHDNPRMLSKIDPEGTYRDVLAKLLAVLQLTLKGTPFLYQGQELGAVNAAFQDMDEIRDVESLNLYKELSGSIPEEALFRKIISGTRDHARVPMKWDASGNCGFTTGNPWIRTFPDKYNVEDETRDEESVLHFYRKMIALRKENKELRSGEFAALKTAREVFAYERGGMFRIVLNLSAVERKLSAKLCSGNVLICNYQGADNYQETDDHQGTGNNLRPYEARVYRLSCNSK